MPGALVHPIPIESKMKTLRRKGWDYMVNVHGIYSNF